jgi:hypothetical protein
MRWIAVALAACSTGNEDDLYADTPPATGDTSTTEDDGPFVTTTDNGDGSFTTVVASTSLVEWVAFSFADGELTVADLASSTDWDLAFQREIILVNAGPSGPGTVDAAVLDGIAFEAIQWPPVAGYAIDAEGDADGDLLEDQVFATWFDYVYAEHRLYPADRRYVVRTPDGAVRMRFDTYYAASDGNSGHPTFTWAWLDAGGPLTGTATALTVDASDAAEWARVSLREWVALAPPDPATSDDWDVAFREGEVALDGGVSGPGSLTAATVAAPWSSVTTAPPSGYVADATGDPALDAFVSDGSGGWTVAPVTFVIARPDGSHDKIGFTAGPPSPAFELAPLP